MFNQSMILYAYMCLKLQ